MKPTAEFRWLRTTADRHPVTRGPLYRATWHLRLQQLWVPEPDRGPNEIRIGEWRDVPTVEEVV